MVDLINPRFKMHPRMTDHWEFSDFKQYFEWGQNFGDLDKHFFFTFKVCHAVYTQLQHIDTHALKIVMMLGKDPDLYTNRYLVTMNIPTMIIIANEYDLSDFASQIKTRYPSLFDSTPYKMNTYDTENPVEYSDTLYGLTDTEFATHTFQTVEFWTTPDILFDIGQFGGIISHDGMKSCDYTNDKHGDNIKVVPLIDFQNPLPCNIDCQKETCSCIDAKKDTIVGIWKLVTDTSQWGYNRLLAMAIPPPVARKVLTVSTQIRICVTMSLSQWKRYFMSRCKRNTVNVSARQIAVALLLDFKREYPRIYTDVYNKMTEDILELSISNINTPVPEDSKLRIGNSYETSDLIRSLDNHI